MSSTICRVYTRFAQKAWHSENKVRNTGALTPHNTTNVNLKYMYRKQIKHTFCRENFQTK